MGGRRAWLLTAVLALLAAAGARGVRGEEDEPSPAAPAAPAVDEATRADLARATDLLREAGALAEASRLGDALEKAREAVEIRTRRLGASLETAEALGELGVLLYHAGRIPEALQALRDALDLRRRLLPKDHPEVLASLANLAAVHSALGQPEQALPLEEEVLEVRRARLAPEDPALAAAKNNLATTYADLGRHDDALALFHEVLDAIRPQHPAGHANVAATINNVAATLDALGRHREALPYHEESLAMRRRLAPPEGDADVAQGLSNLAFCHDELGRYDDAFPLYEEALEILRRALPADHPQTAQTLNNLGHCLGALGRHARSLDFGEAALQMRLRLFPDGHPEVATSLSNVASSYRALGEPEEALPLQLRALEMLRSVRPGDDPLTAAALSGLAATYAEAGRFAEALPHDEEALSMRRRLFGDDHPYVGTSLKNLGLTYAALGRIDEALERVHAAADLHEQTSWADRHLSWTAFGTVLLAAGRIEEAVTPLLAAVRAFEERRTAARGLGPEDRARYAAELRGSDPFPLLVQVYLARGRPEDALTTLERGRAREMLDLLGRAHADPLERAEAEARAAGRRDRLEALASAKASVAAAEGQVSALGRTEARAEAAWTAAGRTPDLDGADWAAAREALRTVRRSAADARRRLLDAAAVQARLVRDVLPEVAPRTAAEIQGLVSGDEQLLVYAFGGSVPYVLLVPAAPKQIRAFELRSEEGPVNEARVARWIDEHEARLDDVPTPHDAGAQQLFRALVPPDLWQELRSARRVHLVPHGPLHRLAFESLVVREHEGRAVHWLDEGPPIAYVPSGSVLAWLRTRSAEQRASRAPLSLVAVGDPVFAGSGDDRAWPETGVLVRAVRPGTQAERVGLRVGDVIVAYGRSPVADAGALRAALAAAEGRVALTVRRGEDVLTPSVVPGALGVDVASEPPAVAGPRLLAGGEVAIALRAATERTRSLHRLPGTRREVDAIRAAFLARDASAPVTALLGRDATESRLFEAIAAGPRVLHLATHGHGDETLSASFSWLALTMPSVPVPGDDGFLTHRDLLGHWRDRLARTELVVLSACDTQRGTLERDEGFQALPGAFHFSGCPTVVGTLWKVSDGDAVPLMTEFYRGLLSTDGEDPLAALLAAKRALRVTRPPSVWAPFVLLGDPR